MSKITQEQMEKIDDIRKNGFSNAQKGRIARLVKRGKEYDNKFFNYAFSMYQTFQYNKERDAAAHETLMYILWTDSFDNAEEFTEFDDFLSEKEKDIEERIAKKARDEENAKKFMPMLEEKLAEITENVHAKHKDMHNLWIEKEFRKFREESKKEIAKEDKDSYDVACRIIEKNIQKSIYKSTVRDDDDCTPRGLIYDDDANPTNLADDYR